MSSRLAFVEDGPTRSQPTEEQLAAWQDVKSRIEARYANELPRAGFLARFGIRRRRRRELARERAKLLPSDYACWLG